MKPAVFSPAARSRSRCSIGSRTRACVPERKIRFASSRYLSSSPTSSNAMMNLARAPCGPWTGLISFARACPDWSCMHSPPFAAPWHIRGAFWLDLASILAAGMQNGLRETPMTKAFACDIAESNGVLSGPWRQPKQMLHAQTYDSHASIHDDATAQKLGFQGGTIEGPTHFSQFAPLCERIWGKAWFETGCLSAHYRNPAFEGEEVQANIEKPKPGERTCTIGMTRRDGTEILRGTASIGRDV